MKKIELYTADKKYVATVEIAAFQTPPGVLMWGSRTFVPGENGIYVETLAVASMTPSPGLARNDEERCTDSVRDGVYMRRCVLVSKHEPSQHNYELVTAENKNQLFVGPPPPVDRKAVTTLRGTPVDKLREIHRNEPTGQHADYIVLTDEERAKGFVRPVRDSYKHLKCGVVTTMGRKLAETYARDPHFYGSTFCTACNAHFPVGETGEFVWAGTDEKVGT